MHTELIFLIADKQPFYRCGIKMALQNLGYKGSVYEVKNGTEVISIISNKEVNVLLIDSLISVVGIDDCIKVIKTEYPSVRIIALLNQVNPTTIEILINHEVDGIISKTCNQEILGEAIEAVTKGNIFRDHNVKELIRKKHMYFPDNKCNRLTSREKEVLRDITFGKHSKEIATHLNVSEETVKKHRRNLLKKIKGHSNAELIRYSLKHYIVGVQEFFNSSEITN